MVELGRLDKKKPTVSKELSEVLERFVSALCQVMKVLGDQIIPAVYENSAAIIPCVQATVLESKKFVAFVASLAAGFDKGGAESRELCFSLVK